MEVQLLYHQMTPSYLTCLGVMKVRDGGKIQEGKCFSCSLVQFDLTSFLFLELIVQFVQTILNSILG
jgi:hypothetical protein